MLRLSTAQLYAYDSIVKTLKIKPLGYALGSILSFTIGILIKVYRRFPYLYHVTRGPDCHCGFVDAQILTPLMLPD